MVCVGGWGVEINKFTHMFPGEKVVMTISLFQVNLSILNLLIIPVPPWSAFTVPYFFCVNVNCLHLGLVTSQVPWVSESTPILMVKGNVLEWFAISQKARKLHNHTLCSRSDKYPPVPTLHSEFNQTPQVSQFYFWALDSWLLCLILTPRAILLEASPAPCMALLFMLFLRTNPACDSLSFLWYLLPASQQNHKVCLQNTSGMQSLLTTFLLLEQSTTMSHMNN